MTPGAAIKATPYPVFAGIFSSPRRRATSSPAVDGFTDRSM